MNPSTPKPAKREWCATLNLSGSIAMVSIVFSCLLTAALLFAPSAAFPAVSSGPGVCGVYVFAISNVADFMLWALVIVLVENISVAALGAFVDVRELDIVSVLNGFKYGKMLDMLERDKQPVSTDAKEQPASTDEFASVASTLETE